MDLSTINNVKKLIKMLYETKPDVHVNYSETSPRIELKNASATIKGVYPSVFIIEECCSRTIPKRHCFQYIDVLTNKVEILELKKCMETNSL